MKKLFLFLLITFQSFSLASDEYPPTLTNFLKCLFTDSESGYVFFGSKPVCYYGAGDFKACLIGSSSHEQEARLRLGIHWLKKARPSQENDNFVLKIKKIDDFYEILSLNKKEILKSVEENLSLFRYVLGPKVTPNSLFAILATSEEPFYKLLNDNNTLVGILLGFGTQNSILGAREEALGDLMLADPEIPYATLSNKTPEESLYRLTLSLMFKDNFKRSKGKIWQESHGFNSFDDELKYIQELHEPSSHLLSTYSPRFIFGSYRSQNDENERVSTLEMEQQKIIALLQSDDFTDQVLKQLSMVFTNPNPNMDIPEPSPLVLACELRNTLRIRMFDSLEGTCEGIQDADLNKDDRYENPDWDIFYDLLAIAPIEKNIRSTEDYFQVLRKNPTYIQLNEDVYIKNLGINENDEPLEILEKEHSKGTFSYVAYLPKKSEWLPVKTDSQIVLNLNEVIPGLALGVQGMKTGEVREIHVHPNASYGFLADYETSEPLKFIVRLESVDMNSPPLILRPKPVTLNRPLFLTQEETDKLNKMTKALSYHTGKKFWNFYKTVLHSSGQNIIDQLKIVWNKPDHSSDKESLDYANVAVYTMEYQQEKERARIAFKNRDSVVSLKNNLLYIQREKQGNGTTAWPKSISLTYKDVDGNVLKKSNFESLTLKELGRLCQGLQIGLKNCAVGDKGTILIDPDLTDQGLFRNKLFHKFLLVEFVVKDPQNP